MPDKKSTIVPERSEGRICNILCWPLTLHATGSVGPCSRTAARRDPSGSFSALRLGPLVSASPAILIWGLLVLLLAFIFLAEAGLRSHALFDVMKV